ncbi:MAG: inositol monophosphatase family protein [Thermodesulfobacteriota bacterium]
MSVDTIDREKVFKVAERAARSAGALLKDALGESRTIEYKGEIDLVTEMDRKAEDLIVGIIVDEFPDHGILTEESSEQKSGGDYRWIIDPIDGTTNFAHGFPVFCISIAFEIDGEVVLGVIYDPTRDELFTALKEKGAFLNGKSISVSKTKALTNSLLATGFPYDIRTTEETNLDHFSNFAVRVQAIRRAGSAALDICYVACGRFDGFWELKLRPWDVAAATLVLIEAGGVATDFRKTSSTIYDSQLLATNSLIHREMIEVLSRK